MKITASFSFRLPVGSKIKVKKGDLVKEGSVLAFTQEGANIKEYDLRQILGNWSGRMEKHLLKRLGQKVKKGELIALRKRGFLKGNQANFISPFDGTLVSINEKGILRLQTIGRKKTITAPLQAEISEISKNELTLSFPALEIKGDWGIGGRKIGPLTCLAKSTVNLFDLNDKFQSKMLVLQSDFNRGFWYKAVSLGLAGIAAVGLAEKDFEEESELPLIVWRNNDALMSSVWPIFLKSEGKKVLIEGNQARILIPQQ